MELVDKVFLVTGAGGGIGRELVRQALDRGAAKVYAGARREVGWGGDPRVVPVHLDVTSAADVDAARARIDDLDVLVNNAGVTGARSLLGSDLVEVVDTYEANVFGPLRLVRAFAPVLAARGGGAVVDIHSVLSWLSGPGAYAPSKTAFWGLTNALRIELAGQGTRVLGAHFGYVDTPMTATVTAPKSQAGEIVARILGALEADEDEVLADDLTRDVHASLAKLSTGSLPGAGAR